MAQIQIRISRENDVKISRKQQKKFIVSFKKNGPYDFAYSHCTPGQNLRLCKENHELYGDFHNTHICYSGSLHSHLM